MAISDWTPWIQPRNKGSARQGTPSLLVLANRAPFRHEVSASGAVRRQRSASGLVTAIEPLLLAAAGTWVAYGEEDDLRAADADGHVTVTSDASQYRLRYVGIDRREYQGFYGGFSNEALWPLCHASPVSPTFRPQDFSRYRSANRRFASAVIAEGAGRSPVVLVQDYHFALAPRWIRRGLPGSAIVSFWHIPWPQARLFGSCPWSRQLLHGLLGSDVVGMQTDQDCRHFLDAIALLLDADVDYEQGVVDYRGRAVRVRAYPVGVQWDPPMLRTIPAPEECRRQLCAEFGLSAGGCVAVGVDRMDYTKGIAEKCAVVEQMLERRPDLRERFVLIQVAEPSRQALEAYRQTQAAAAMAADRVNTRFGRGEHRPIILVERHLDAPEVFRLYRAADVCYVNSLDDGMNLVAKEFVSARSDERGVLLLSEFAGASWQLPDAVPVNPYAIERSVRALEHALEMPCTEQSRRMRAMRQVVAASDSTWWASQLLRDSLAPRPAWATAARAPSVRTLPLRPYLLGLA